MKYNIYLDESGNTGDIKIKDGKWNWGNQPYFALGSICIEANKEKEFYNDLEESLNSFQAGLGTETELKGKKNYKFKKELACSIVDILKKYNARISIDISNKKFKIATNITNYCIYPYYIHNKNNEYMRYKSVNAANIVYNIDEEILEEFINLCYSDEDENIIKSNFINFLERLSKSISDKEINNSIAMVKEYIENHEQRGLSFNNLFPIMDKTNKGAKTFFLPNLEAYLNIISSTSTLRLRSIDNLNIYHDEQKQFSSALKKWTNDIKLINEIENINELKFKQSKSHIIIQVTDFITGISIQTFTKIINSCFLNSEEINFIKSINYLLSNCNIVAPKYEQEKFGDAAGIKMGRTTVPIVF